MWIVGLCLIGKNIYGASDSGVCSPKKQDYAFLKNFQDIFWKKKNHFSVFVVQCDQTTDPTGHICLHDHCFEHENLKYGCKNHKQCMRTKTTFMNKERYINFAAKSNI